MSEQDDENARLAKNKNYNLEGLYLIATDARKGEFYFSSAIPPRGYEFFILTKPDKR